MCFINHLPFRKFIDVHIHIKHNPVKFKIVQIQNYCISIC